MGNSLLEKKRCKQTRIYAISTTGALLCSSVR